YPVAQLDQGRIPVSRGVSSLQRPRQVSSVVRRRRAKPMARMQWLSCTALLLAFLALLAGCQPAASPAPAAREQELTHFDGVVDHGRQTTDPVLSDLYVRAARALEAGDAAAAEALYREAVAKYPADPDGYTALGACLVYQRRYDDARAE